MMFLLWPFWAFVIALFNYSQKDSKKVVYFFLIYYGLSFVVPGAEFSSQDSVRYAMNFVETASLPFSYFFDIMKGLNSAEQTTIDIVAPFIGFAVSRFTSNYVFLFAAYAAVFGFFYLRSINLLHNRFIDSARWGAFVHLAFFTWILPITSINGFRMWTAAWVFFYGAYHVVLYRDAKYFLYTLGACLVHFSFMTVNAVLILYYFAGNRNLIYVPVVILSFIVPYYLMPAFQAISEFLGGQILNRFEGYSSTGYGASLQAMMNQSSWFVKLYNSLLYNYILIGIVVIQVWFRKHMNNKHERNLFSFILLFISFVNFSSVIPSFSRFQLIFYLFGILYLFLFFLKVPDNKLNILKVAGAFPMLLYAAVTFRIGADSINAWLISPLLGSPFFAPVISVADLLF